MSTASFFVAPFAGAWIEIQSLSKAGNHASVAPFAGAWIEISTKARQMSFDFVAPFAGAWIEIAVRTHYTVKVYASLPSRERGLKFYMEKK